MPNGAIRICGDFKGSQNKYDIMQRFLQLHSKELCEAPTGGKIFSKVYLADAYY